jgi:Uma2 family endonuclease
MAVGAQISVDEYLHTMYHPDCDYVDGMVEERNLGEVDHGLAQLRLGHFFMGLFRQTGLLPMTEVRMQTSATRLRIPDVAVTRGKPKEQILTEPPLLCIEILSPEDRMSRMNLRIQEYLDFGVPVVWLVDPAERRVWVYRKTGMKEATDSVSLDGTDITVPFSEIFD